MRISLRQALFDSSVASNLSTLGSSRNLFLSVATIVSPHGDFTTLGLRGSDCLSTTLDRRFPRQLSTDGRYPVSVESQGLDNCIVDLVAHGVFVDIGEGL